MMKLAHILLMNCIILSLYAQETGSSGGGNFPDFLPKEQVISKEKILAPLMAGEYGAGSGSSKKQQFKARMKELKITQLSPESYLKTGNLIEFVNQIKNTDHLCAEQYLKKSPLTTDLQDVFDITQKINKVNLTTILNGKGGIGPLHECNCEKDKAYMKCLKSNIDISQHPFSKLTDQEKKQVYMIYHFNSSKSFDELENQYKFVKETLPHLFNDDK